MKKRFYKYIFIAILLITVLVSSYFYLFNNYLKFDRKFVNQLEKYQDIDIDLKKDNLSDFRSKYKSSRMFPHVGVSLDFVIYPDTTDFLKTRAPLIHEMFSQKLIESILILSEREILFQLKWCDRPNCIKDEKGFHGFYTHYLSKDKIHFKKLSDTKLIAQKSFGEWTYYIVWSAKG